MYILQNVRVVAEYGCGTYGGGTYQGACTTSSTGSNNNNNNPLDNLANTGFDILIPLFLGLSLIAAGLILFVRRYLRSRNSRVNS